MTDNYLRYIPCNDVEERIDHGDQTDSSILSLSHIVTILF